MSISYHRRVGIVSCLMALSIPLGAQITDSAGRDTVHYKYEFIAHKPARDSYTQALRVLIDDGYITTSASRDAGVIQTELREIRYLPGNRFQRAVAKSIGMRTSVQLNVMILDLSPDSSRVTLTGRQSNALTDGLVPIKSKKGETALEDVGWDTLRAVGEKIEAALK
jgi:hypothetical protein